MRNPEDTKYVWDKKNFNIIQKNIMNEEDRKEIKELNKTLDSCVDYLKPKKIFGKKSSVETFNKLKNENPY